MPNEVDQLLASGTAIPACPLAIHKDKSFDEFHQRLLVHYYVDAGAGGLAVGVHTTQFEIREPQFNLFETVLATVASELALMNLQRPFIKVAGICGNTEQAVHEAEIAKRYQYDYALLTMNNLDDYSEAQLLERTRAVAEVLPVFGFYLQETIGKRAFSFDFWRQFMEIPNVAAVKTAPFNRYQTLDVLRAVCESSRRDEIAVYTGNDDNIVPDLLTTYQMQVGGLPTEKSFAGGLLGHWAVWTAHAVQLLARIKAAKAGKDDAMALLKLGTQVTDANAAFFDTANQFRGSIAGINEVLARTGLLEGNYCLSDRERLSPGQSEAIDRVSAAYPWLRDDEFIQAHLQKWQEAVHHNGY
jgi:dihydrodipicolinate synthase/N-acetylneuraminate lyase